MIPKHVFQFLQELTANNNREWFQANKKAYEQSKSAIEDFIKELIIGVQSFDDSVVGITPKDCMFRINRDVRFSNDKSPYKTNIGGFIAKGGRNAMNAGYYLHIEPDKSFLGGGIYLPPADKLKMLRNEIYFNAPIFKKIIADTTFKKYFTEIWDDAKLKNAPKDFPKDFADIDLLKFKNYTIIHPLKDEQIMQADFYQYVLDVFKAMFPLNRFLINAISHG
ncbi:MAG: DUF2461 domain-containing protein [Bacteroidetes bacterium]|nr:DUF2461 domain-containing protein [Bacteroidota bacterium]